MQTDQAGRKSPRFQGADEVFALKKSPPFLIGSSVPHSMSFDNFLSLGTCLEQWMYASSTSITTQSQAGEAPWPSDSWGTGKAALSTILAVPLTCSPIVVSKKSRKSKPRRAFSTRLPMDAITPFPRYSG